MQTMPWRGDNAAIDFDFVCPAFALAMMTPMER